MLAEIVRHPPEEVFVHVPETVLLPRKDEHVETFVRTDEGVDDADGVCRMHVVVDIPVHQEEMPFQVLCYLGIGVYLVDKRCVPLLADLLRYAVMLFAPPAVVDSVVVVPCA